MFDTALSAAVGQVEVTIANIQAIANTTLPAAETDVTTKSNGFRSLTLPPDKFGDVPIARALAEQHQAAHKVFVETVEGVIKDLQEFRQNLLDSMKAHENTDDSVHSTLTALGARYRDHTYHSDENWKRERQAQGDKLATNSEATHATDVAGTTGTEPGTDTGAQTDGQTADPAPTNDRGF
jgi:hypothetical protein